MFMAGLRSHLTIKRDATHKTRMRARAGMMSLVFACAFVVLGARLVELGFPPEGYNQSARLLTSSTVMHRPDIVDAKGRMLATDIQTGSLFANPSRIEDVDTTVEQLATVLTHVNPRALRKRLTAGGKFLWIARELTPRQQAQIHELGLPGLAFVQEPHRVYPAGATASHILGHVNVDNHGLAGAESYLDKLPSAVAATGKKADKKKPIRLAMDLSVQHAVREELGQAMKLYKAKAAAAVVLDVHSGEIVALSSMPDYDPNRRKEALKKDRFNRVTSGVFELGSVFKVFTTAGALDLGVTSLDKGYDARNPLKVASFTIHDFHAKRRWLSVPEIFIYSSNIGAAKMALDMGVKRHKAFLGKLGLLDRMNTEMGLSAAPIVPKNWSRLNTMTISYGHGLSVTPLQLASATATLVNGGYKVNPTFLERSREEAQKNSKRVVKLQTSDLMRYLLRLNVQQGSGKRANTVGYRVGGKTGTAEKVVNGKYSRSRLLNSFLGVFPMDAPEYVVLVVLDEPQKVKETGGRSTAGVNAAPTVGRIIERIGPMLNVIPVLDEGGVKFDEHVNASY
jgi:cell division protein FtsI (penicillin-binding protein 3)